MVPKAMALLITPLIPKQGGKGRRPIGVYSASLRLMQAVTKKAGREWMETYSRDHPELSAAPTRSALDPLWRTAAVAHMARGEAHHAGPNRIIAATMTVDIKAFFDKLPPQRAADAAIYAGIPFWVVRLAFAGYSLHRHPRVGKVYGGAIVPAAGIVAGDTVAMYVVAAFMAVGLAGMPETRQARRLITGYVDDWQVTILGPITAVKGEGPTICTDFLERITSVGLEVNKAKMAMVSDDRKTAIHIATAIGAPILSMGHV